MRHVLFSNRIKRVGVNAACFAVAGIVTAGLLSIHRVAAQQQPPVTTQPSNGIAQLLSDIQHRRRELVDARSALIEASLVTPVDLASLKEKAANIADAEIRLAAAVADAVAQNQQPAAAKAAADRGYRIPNIPRLTSTQAAALTDMVEQVAAPTAVVTTARASVTKAALAEPRNNDQVRAAISTLATAELRLATARAAAFAKIQSSSEKLSPTQIPALIAMGGSLKLGGFSEPKPIDFNDHDGYVSLFDGVSLKGWDGSPKVWRVENGMIVGESTVEHPSGNTYLVYRDLPAKDFTLKFEIKIDGTGGSGMQYRSKTGVPWLAPVADNVPAPNPDWMMTGPQADFWPTQIYSGQFYSENTPMRIIAWRGQVVESAGLGTKRLMGTIGDRRELGKLENKNDWNQYTVIARGGTFIHIMNGQLMSVLVDDDATSSNNQSGLIGIEIESITKLFVRNVWLKKLN